VSAAEAEPVASPVEVRAAGVVVPLHRLTVIGGGPAGRQGLCRCGETFDGETADEISAQFRAHEHGQLSLF
jgi:hypothetical protein